MEKEPFSGRVLNVHCLHTAVASIEKTWWQSLGLVAVFGAIHRWIDLVSHWTSLDLPCKDFLETFVHARAYSESDLWHPCIKG